MPGKSSRRNHSSRYYVNPKRDRNIRIGRAVLIAGMGLVAILLVLAAVYGDRIFA